MTGSPCVKCGASERDKHGACRACARRRAAERRAKNPDRTAARAANAAYRAANPEKRKATNAAWYSANKDKARARALAWKAANPVRAKEAKAIWRAANLDRHRVHEHRRRALKKACVGQLSSGIVQVLMTRQRGRCACGCGEPLGDDYHLDHIMPLALGGSNSDDNAQLLRKACNLSKAAKHPIAFMQSRGFLL